MGKKKIALVDLSQSDTPQLKASGVRSQKLIIKKQPKAEAVPVAVKEPIADPETKATDKKSAKAEKTHTRVKHPKSKRYLEAKAKIDKNKLYPLAEAIKLLKEVSKVKFDPSVEFHAVLSVEKLSGELELPHGTGKTVKVEIASDATLTKLNDNLIDFDILVAEPKMMPKLAKYAKMLGPKGLMPNPKTNTISEKPEELKKKLEGGAMRYKSEPKAPLIHLNIGKLSFKDEQLLANIETVLKTLLVKNIKLAYLCSSMSPSIKLQLI